MGVVVYPHSLPHMVVIVAGDGESVGVASGRIDIECSDSERICFVPNQFRERRAYILRLLETIL